MWIEAEVKVLPTKKDLRTEEITFFSDGKREVIRDL